MACFHPPAASYLPQAASCRVEFLPARLVSGRRLQQGESPVLGDPFSREKRKNLENASSAELATLVRDMVGSRAGIVHASLPKDDPVRRNPDIALAQKLLGGWTPQVPLERGLEATIAYFRGLNGRPNG